MVSQFLVIEMQGNRIRTGVVGQAVAAPGVPTELPSVEKINCSSCGWAGAEQVPEMLPLLVVNESGRLRSL